MKINSEAQIVIDKIATIARNYGEVWNEEKVVEAMREYYAELNVPMPEIIVANDLVMGYTTARDAARDAALDAALDAAQGAAWGAARGAAQGAAWGAAYLNTGLKDSATLKMVAIESKVLKALEFGLGVFFPMKDKLILVPMPKLRLNDRLRLHSEMSPAVEWKKGAKFYFLHGVKFEKNLWTKIIGKEISSKEALEIESADQRAIVLQFIGGERLMKDFNGFVISEDEYGQLIEFKTLIDTNGKPYRYLVAPDPSKDNKRVWLRCNPDCKTPAEAEARSYRLDRFKMKYAPSSRT